MSATRRSTRLQLDNSVKQQEIDNLIQLGDAFQKRVTRAMANKFLHDPPVSDPGQGTRKRHATSLASTIETDICREKAVQKRNAFKVPVKRSSRKMRQVVTSPPKRGRGLPSKAQANTNKTLKFCSVYSSLMSKSKPVAPFLFDLLCYLNRDQLERFSIVCRALKNIIERYFYTKPHRTFDKLIIRGGSYALIHNNVQWYPNRDDYSVQKFLNGQKLISLDTPMHSFADMHPYLGPNIRIKIVYQYVAAAAYVPDQITEMESIAYLWRDGKVEIWDINRSAKRIGGEDFLPILNSPTILQCRDLEMVNTDFSFRNYKVLYSVNFIEISYITQDIDPNHWLDFFEQPGVKPVVALLSLNHTYIDNTLECLSKAFSSAIKPNAFKIVFALYDEYVKPEFRETNNTSGEKLELKKGIPIEYQHRHLNYYEYYTLERSRI